MSRSNPQSRMDCRGLWKLSILLTAAEALNIIQSCDPTPKPVQLARRAVITSEAAIPNNSRNIGYQIQRAPCLQLEYVGLSLGAASRIVIYGTCNYERMFRFSTVFVPAHNCWQSWMATWQGENCETGNFTNDCSFGHRGDSTFNEHFSSLFVDLLDEAVTSSDHLGRECDCSASRSMADFWRGKCWDGGKILESNWELEPKSVVQFTLMIVGMYLLGWGVVRFVTP